MDDEAQQAFQSGATGSGLSAGVCTAISKNEHIGLKLQPKV